METSEIHRNPPGTNREVLYNFILENCNDLAPWKTNNQNILMAFSHKDYKLISMQ